MFADAVASSLAHVYLKGVGESDLLNKAEHLACSKLLFWLEPNP